MANPGSFKVTFASWLQIASGKTVTECMAKVYLTVTVRRACEFRKFQRVLKEADVNTSLEEFMYSLLKEGRFQRVLKEADVNISLEEFMYSLLKECRVVVSKMPHEVLRARLRRQRVKSKKHNMGYSEKRPRLPRSNSPPGSTAASATDGNPHSVIHVNEHVKVKPSPRSEHTTRRSKRQRLEERMKELFGSVTPPPELIQTHPTHLSPNIDSSNNITMEKQVEKSGPITSQIVFEDSTSDDEEDDVIFVESVDSTNNNLFVTKYRKDEKESHVYDKPCPKSRKRNNVIILGNKRKRCTETENNAEEEVNASAHTPRLNSETSGHTNVPSTEVNSANDHAITSVQKRDHIPEKEICSMTDTEKTGGKLSISSIEEINLDSNEKGELLTNRKSNNSEVVHDKNIFEPKVHTIGDAIINDILLDLIEETTHDIKQVKTEIDTIVKPLLENNAADDQINTRPKHNLKEFDNAFVNTNCPTDKPNEKLDYTIKDTPKISVKPIESMLSQRNSDNNETLMNIKNWESIIPTNDIPNIIPPTVEQPKEINIPPAVQSPAFNIQLLKEDVAVNPCSTQQTSKSPTVHQNNQLNVDSRTGNEMKMKYLAEYVVRLMEERTKFKQSIAEAEKYSNNVIKNEMVKTARTLLKQCEKFILQASSPYFQPKYMHCFQNMAFLDYLKRCAKAIATKTEPFNDCLYTEVLMDMCAKNYKKLYAIPKTFENDPTDVPLTPTQYSESYNQDLSHKNNANKNRIKKKTYRTEPPSSVNTLPIYTAPPPPYETPDERSRNLQQNVRTYVGGTQRGTSLMAHYENQTPIQHQHITANGTTNFALSQMHPHTNITLNQQNFASKGTEHIPRPTTTVLSRQYKSNMQILNTSTSNQNSANRSHLPGEVINKSSQVNQVIGTSIQCSQHVQYPYPSTSVSSQQYERNTHILATNSSNQNSANITGTSILRSLHVQPPYPSPSVSSQQYERNAHTLTTNTLNQNSANRHPNAGELMQKLSQLNQVNCASIQGSQHIQHPYPSASVPSQQYERNAHILTTNPLNQNSANINHHPGELTQKLSQLNQITGASIQGSQYIQHQYPSTNVPSQQCESNAQFMTSSSSNQNSFTKHSHNEEPYENSSVYKQYQTSNVTENLQGVATITNSNIATWDLINKPQNQSAVGNQHYYYQNSEMYGAYQNVPSLVRVTGTKLSNDGLHSQTPPAPVLLDQVHTSHHIRSQSRDSGFMSPSDAATSPAIETLVSSGTSLMAQGQCKICKMTTILKCTGCYDVFYCSNHCQTHDWPRHRFQCTAVKV